MWLLDQGRDSRIFQDASVPEVVEDVLGRHHIELQWNLSTSYPKRAYITQYEESDLAFARRLLAEAGIFFARVHQEVDGRIVDGQPFSVSEASSPVSAGAAPSIYQALHQPERLFLCDEPDGYRLMADPKSGRLPHHGVAALHFSDREGMSGPTFDHVSKFELQRSVHPNIATYREYDPDRPGALLAASARVPKSGRQAQEAGHELEHYEHHGTHLFPDWDYSESEGQRILRQLRRRVTYGQGSSAVPTLEPGYRFTLDDHPDLHGNHEFVATRIEHEGWGWTTEEQTDVYRNTFECVPSDVLACPERPDRRAVQVALTATVVGPGQDDIHVDRQGRIRVRFHWDRREHRDEHDTCWIRTMQAWGGAAWGTQFIPRVGMEVVVTFEGGDPDKPLVLGSVYNGAQSMPFATPGNKTRSGIRTRTSVGGGFNELSFEDKKGEEQIYIRAEQDLVAEVQRNQASTVGGDASLRVRGSLAEQVDAGARRVVSGGLTQLISGTSDTRVEGSSLEQVNGNREVHVTGVATRRIDGHDLVNVAGPAKHEYVSDVTERVIGNKTTVVGRSEAPRGYSLHVEGAANFYASRPLELISEAGIVLRCGKAAITLGPDKVELDAPRVAVSAPGGTLTMDDDGLRVETPGAIFELTDQGIIMRTSAGASGYLGTEVKFDGKKVLLNSPELAEEAPPPPPNDKTLIELRDPLGNPLANERYVIVMPDGSERTGRLDAEGRAEVDLDEDARIRFPDVTNVARS